MTEGLSTGLVILHCGLLTVLALTVLFMLRSGNIFSLIMLSGLYSLTSATWFVAMNAIDVAFTEAAIGAGIYTCFLLAGLILAPAQSGRPELRPNPWKSFSVLVITAVTGVLLLYAAIDLPVLGDGMSPANAYLGRLFIERTPEDIGVPNVVTAVLASYRGFDTFGETVVIFTAAVAALVLLGGGTGAAQQEPAARSEPTDTVIVTIAKMMMPFLFLFGFYVQFHGDYGPGGGFQAGVVLAVAIMLYALVFGPAAALERIPERFIHLCTASGVLLYGGVGVANMLAGGVFLDYDFLYFGSGEDHHHSGQHLGILLVELGVMATVAGAMTSIFFALVSHHKTKEKPDG